MNDISKKITLCGTLFVMGFLFFVLYNNYIIIQIPYGKSSCNEQLSFINKKSITFYYVHNERWKSDVQEHLWSDDMQDNLFNLVNAWLIVLEQESVITKKAMLQSALISQSGTAYLSFDHTIFSKEDSIFRKWMLIEGLLKTVRSNTVSVSSIQLLVHHQLLNDPHLEMGMPWPVNGFFKE